MQVKRQQITVEKIPARFACEKDSKAVEVIPEGHRINLRRGEFILRDFWVDANFIHADIGEILGVVNDSTGLIVAWFAEDDLPRHRVEAINFDTLQAGLLPLSQTVKRSCFRFWKISYPDGVEVDKLIEAVNLKFDYVEF